MLKQVKHLSSEHTWLFDCLFLAAIIGTLYTIFLGSSALAVPDEARYSEIPREMLLLRDFITPHLNFIKYFEKPPLFYWMQTLSIRLFGLNETALRLATMLMGITGCIITYAAARKLFTRQIGIVSAIILASSFLYYGMAHLITLDMTLAAFLTGALSSFLLATREQKDRTRRNLMWIASTCSALAVMTKGLVGLLLPGMIIFAWVLVFNQWRMLTRLSLPSSIAIFFAITIPWHVAVQHQHPEFFHYYFITQQFSRYFTQSAGRYKPDWFFIPILFAGFFPWSVFLIQTLTLQCKKLRMNFYANKHIGFLVLWAAVLLVFFSLSNSKLIPYLVPIFSPLAILSAEYLCKQTTRTTKTGIIILVFSSLALGVAAMVAGTLLPIKATISLLILGCLFTLSSITISYYYKKQSTLKTFSAAVIMCALTYPLIHRAVPLVDTRSIKPLALELRPLLKPSDVVVCFKHYYQDLPVYIKRGVLIADWRNELDFGATHQASGAEILISIPEFYTLWSGNKTVYALTRTRYYEELLHKRPDMHIYLLGSTTRNVLISNKEPTR